MNNQTIEQALREATMNQLSLEVGRRIKNISASLQLAKEIRSKIEDYQQKDMHVKSINSEKVFENCKKAVCFVLQIDFEQITAKIKKQEIVDARHILAYLARKNSTIGYKRLGELLQRNHATIINSVNVVNDAFVGNKKLVEKLIACEQFLKNLNADQDL